MERTHNKLCEQVLIDDEVIARNKVQEDIKAQKEEQKKTASRNSIKSMEEETFGLESYKKLINEY